MSSERARIPAATRVIQQPDGGRVMVVRKSRLEVLAGPDKGLVHEIGAEPTRVGSGEDCDVVLADAAVSTHHLEIVPLPDGFLLRDEDSTNGTFVDGYRVRSIYLPATATIELGETRLSFSISSEELELPLSRRTKLGGLLGHSEVMRAVFAVLERVAKADATLLIEGESGTGKDVAARAVHERSARSGGLFLAVDCGAIPHGLMESELFGHRRGAFTGATNDRVGPFEAAEGGTVFLDEIGELPLELQPKLLRALETRTVRRVGDNDTRAFDARLIAATNRNLQQEVRAGRFREDLYFRISVIRVRMPPLRERREEIPRLVAHFLSELGRDPSEPLPESVGRALNSHNWPGNVRELRNVVERLALIPGMSADYYLDGSAGRALHGDGSAGEGDEAAAGGGIEVPLDKPFHEGKAQWIELFERSYLSRMLDRCEGNISELARVTGLSRQSCHRLLARHDLV
ncbi:MAG: sigma 54-dependent Fis family transcriptional regulator [Myxococcales bacterium]|nr:sigma 54-dependent Fis family transcriptional regulator [Myxococcales bacterium]